MAPDPDEVRGNVYSVLRDVLRRPDEIDATRVHYRPSTAERRYLEAFVHPDRLDPPAGPETPSITVRWARRPPHDEFRIDYADPNVDVHCGWHRDDDHPEYGPVHFQYDHPGVDGPVYESASFEASSPPRILWEVLDRLFEDVVPTIAGELYEG